MSNLLFFFKKKRKNNFSKFICRNKSKTLINRIGVLGIILFLHTLIIQYVEPINFSDALWLSLTSITTVGYGDYSATTFIGRAATILLIYVCGIWLLAQLAGDLIDYRTNKRERMIKGLWRWKNMSDYILIINTPLIGGDRYLIRLVEQLKRTPEMSSKPIRIATHAYPNGLPDELRQLGVVHNHVDTGSTIHLEELDVLDAQYIIVLCQDENDARSDSLTLDMLDRIAQKNTVAFIVAECILDENRERFLRLQADAVIRPIRSYPELIVRTLSAPGTERILENLFTHDGASTQRFDIDINDITWQDIACKIISAGIGTPLGFISHTGEVITNPSHNQAVSAKALLIMVSEKQSITNNTLANILQ
ncbi:MAG: voltage-gated potassium channel [Candidatus Endobugula sp.]|jgi:voltage-gated potassium channel